MGQRRDRRWTEDLRVYDEAGNYLGVDRDRGIRAMIEVETILAREGGAVTVMPVRVEQPPLPGGLTNDPEMANVGYIFEHVFAPTAGRVAAPQAPQNGQQQPAPTFPQMAAAAAETMRDQDEAAVAQALEGDEPSAVMPQGTDPADQHTDPRPSDLPEPAPVSRADLTPRVS